MACSAAGPADDKTPGPCGCGAAGSAGELEADDSDVVDDADDPGALLLLLLLLLVVVGCRTKVTGYACWVVDVEVFDKRRCTACLKASLVQCRSKMCVISENRFRGRLSHKFGPGPH